MSKTRDTRATTRTTGRIIRKNTITFDKDVYIKFKSTFNATNPKESKREYGIF